MVAVLNEFPNFLMVENARNHDAHRTFERFLHRAIGPCRVLVAHHIVFIPAGSDDPTEIPSADSLCFNHQLMTKVFGEVSAPAIMLTLAKRTPDLRDKVLADFLDALDLEDPAGVLAMTDGQTHPALIRSGVPA